MKIQDYLRSGKTPADLTNELGIRVTEHPTLPLAIFNYDQIESPKIHPIVREARGLVLENGTWNVVAMSFPRFFNWGEVQEEMSLFDFSDFVVQSKEDGSLVLLYYYAGQWRCNTRGSFAQDLMQFQNFTWEEGIKKALGVDLQDAGLFPPTRTYVCEFCTPWNKIVRTYSKPVLYLLTVFDNQTQQEYSPAQVDAMYNATLSKQSALLRPTVYQFHNMGEIEAFLQQQATDDATFEGVVIRDKNNQRWKIKNPCYLALHKMRGEGDNLFNPKNLVPFVMAGEEDELLTYFEEASGPFFKLKSRCLEWYVQLLEVWVEHKDIIEQKEFALSIHGKTPFTGILFQLRKEHGKNQNLHHLREAWKNAGPQILKILK